jgi:uncharacterized protein YjaG (DUF416 family)
MVRIDIDRLRGMEFSKQITFAYLICERLYPNYVHFSENSGFGSPTILKNSIDFLYNSISDNTSNAILVNRLVQDIDKITPDTDDFTVKSASFALDVCTAVLDGLNFLLDKEFFRIKNISIYALDTIILGLPSVDGMDSHPLIENEVRIQSGIIAYLAQSAVIDIEDIETLKKLQSVSR